MNEEITYRVLQACVDAGAREFVVCAGSRNSSFVEALRVEEQVNTYYWPEERSAAFFAMGRARKTQRPVAIVTTLGTACGEMLPAAMEAHYSGVPLILITADRPRHFRGSGAPQSAEQEGMFGFYAKPSLDIAAGDPCDLSMWNRTGPVHLNVCLEEPQKQPKFHGRPLQMGHGVPKAVPIDLTECRTRVDTFLKDVERPLAIVSTLKPEDREPVAQLLMKLGMPVMIDGISGLREDLRLQPLAVLRTDKVLESASECGYAIDGILRIGGIPTHRIWRDLEYLNPHVKVCNISSMPFSGLSWSRNVVQGPVGRLLEGYAPAKDFDRKKIAAWLSSQSEHQEALQELFREEPLAEPSLIASLSQLIPNKAHIYLGNSLPVREWDMAAVRQNKQWDMAASRGVNGIDGQISTFLGLCRPGSENWGIFGDLTMLYDMAGFWILPKLEDILVNIVVINNGGGKIFQRMYPYKEMLNEHRLKFKPLAEMWGMDYQMWNSIPSEHSASKRGFIEIVPDNEATQRFWKKYESIGQRKTEEARHAG